MTVSVFFIPVVPPNTQVSVKVLDGRPVNNSPITHVTLPIHMSIPPQHTKHIRFHILHHHSVPFIVLGLPWLRTHSSVVD